MHQGQLVYNNRMSELQQASLTNDLHVHFSRPPGLEEIKAIDGIKIALQLDTNHFLISSERADINETISHLAVNLDWGLQEMYRDKQTLEQIFIKLTSCEAQAA